jgi:hypothetical protein
MENEAPRRRGRPRKFQEDANSAILDAPKTEKPIERPAMRTEMRDRNPRAEAERRAAEILGHVGNLDEGTDDFYVDPNKIPDGWTYEWKRKTVYGQEDPAYQVQLARTGWTAVPASRHPEMMPAAGGFQTIERKGQILMERPQIVTDQVVQLNNRRARDQVRVKEQQLSSAPDGQFGRDHAQVKPKINKGYEPVPIPGDK